MVPVICERGIGLLWALRGYGYPVELITKDTIVRCLW